MINNKVGMSDLSKLEKKIQEKISPLEIDKEQTNNKMSLAQLKELAKKIQKFESASNAPSVAKSRG